MEPSSGLSDTSQSLPTPTYECQAPGCGRAYSKKTSLDNHIRNKHVSKVSYSLCIPSL